MLALPAPSFLTLTKNTQDYFVKINRSSPSFLLVNTHLQHFVGKKPLPDMKSIATFPHLS